MDRYVAGWQAGSAHGGALAPVKTVYLVRHGESTHNARAYAALGADPNDPRYLDAPLTARGAEQANALAPRVRDLGPQLVVSSPLTRAVDTCMRACATLLDTTGTAGIINNNNSGSTPRTVPRVVVRPECTERLAYACDIGSPVPVLKNRFPVLDFANVLPANAWWWTPVHLENPTPRSSLSLLRAHPPGSRSSAEPQHIISRRISSFRTWLAKQPESKIIVFGHGAYLRRMMASHASKMAGVVPWFSNCEIRTIRF